MDLTPEIVSSLNDLITEHYPSLSDDIHRDICELQVYVKLGSVLNPDDFTNEIQKAIVQLNNVQHERSLVENLRDSIAIHELSTYHGIEGLIEDLTAEIDLPETVGFPAPLKRVDEVYRELDSSLDAALEQVRSLVGDDFIDDGFISNIVGSLCGPDDKPATKTTNSPTVILPEPFSLSKQRFVWPFITGALTAILVFTLSFMLHIMFSPANGNMIAPTIDKAFPIHPSNKETQK